MSPITPAVVRCALNRCSNGSTPSPDKIRTGGQKWPISISTTITAIFLFLVPFFPPFLQNVPFQNVFRLQIIDSRLQIAEIVGCRM